MRAALARLTPFLHRPDRYQVVQSLKAAAAAIIAWALTGWWLDAPMALMAPWAAVALVQGTVYRSLRTAVQLFVMIAAGTLLAAGAAALTGDTMIAMVVALPLATLLGNLASVGGQGLYASTTALFVLAYGSYSLPAVGHRLLETLVGAVVGVAVNAVVLPPVHSLHAGKLAAALPRDCARLLREMGDGLEEYDAQRAESWNRSANDLLTALSELYVGRRWDSESFRLNPVRRLRRSTPAPSADWDIVWARVANRLLGLTLTLWETASENRELPRPPDRALDELGRLLSAAADACTAYGTIMAHGDDEEGRDRRDTALADAHRALASLKGRLDGQEPDVGAAIGSLVADCQALLDDLTPEA
ncbi:FUSC family protein [Streptomyces californicus]|uniref:FUSC family protein n=1 Tax=Streptomyces californicus TaxID=67351 RepID=A0ABD7D656_9ACTN|nr:MULTISPECIES: FUSC family protein [Streptomyces]MCC0576215.1 aromatic acid exporter family protein [Streptomyces californicus]QRV26103.1 FUSC family protein [Streptomyces californicus]QRV38234.1 FUSC family protein [Streptomyces californicus]QRV39505.1 FUSC family protein [Streptomyces californicus]QRV46254.1 FUSC family protein [Streptomyces californicus]